MILSLGLVLGCIRVVRVNSVAKFYIFAQESELQFVKHVKCLLQQDAPHLPHSFSLSPLSLDARQHRQHGLPD